MRNIVFSGNNKYFKGVLLNVLSLLKYNSDPVSIYLLGVDLPEINPLYVSFTENNVKLLEKIVKEKNNQSRVIPLDVTELYKEKILNTKNADTPYSPYTFLRMFLNEIDEIPDKILYLDVDTMFLDDVKLLYDIDITDYEYAAVKDAFFGKFANYINAGVLLLNIKKIKETNLFNKAIEYMNKKRLFAPDQTAINKCTTKKLVLDTRFNTQRKLRKDTVIKHFIKRIHYFPYPKMENIKQWEFEKVNTHLKIHQFNDIFEDYKKNYEHLLD